MVSLEILLGVTLLSVILFLLGVQIVLVFAFWPIVIAMTDPFLTLEIFAITTEKSLRSFQLAAIPLFIFLGSMISEFGASEKIIRFTRSFAGWLPGAIGNTAIYTAGVFAAVTGSNTATTAAVGEALHEEMEDEGYDSAFAAATVASGGTLGVIIPPSSLLILYGVYFNVSISELFIAGVIPGILMMLSLSAVCSVIAYRNGYQSDFSFSLSEVLRSSWHAKNAFITILVLLGGIFSGIYTPTESATAAFFYFAIAEILQAAVKPFFSGVRYTDSSLSPAKATESTGGGSQLTDYETRKGDDEHSLSLSEKTRQSGVGIWRTLRRIRKPFMLTVTLLGAIMPLYVNSIMIQKHLSVLGIVSVIGDLVTAVPSVPGTMLTMFLLLIISGSVLASVPNMILMAPLLAPAADALGLSPVMWGILFMITDSIGFITPPYGLNLYIISSLTGIDYIRVAYAALPYLVALLSVFLFFFIFPQANILV
jgi:C4-dicarboxylate transporter DctM subunit